MYRRLFTAASVSGQASSGETIDLNAYNMKKLHLMAKVTFESQLALLNAFLRISAYGKEGELYKLKEYEFNPAFMNDDYELFLSDVIDVEPISAINIRIGTQQLSESAVFDVEIEWEEKGLC